MTKRLSFAFVLALVVASALTVGCGQSAPTAPTPTPTPTPTPEPPRPRIIVVRPFSGTDLAPGAAGAGEAFGITDPSGTVILEVVWDPKEATGITVDLFPSGHRFDRSKVLGLEKTVDEPGKLVFTYTHSEPFEYYMWVRNRGTTQLSGGRWTVSFRPTH